MPLLESKLPDVGTTIFTVMSRKAEEHGAINLSQGFPDFALPVGLGEALARHVAAGRNQYAPMAGVLALREQIALKLERCYGCRVDPETEVTVVPGATEAIFCAIMATVRATGHSAVITRLPHGSAYLRKPLMVADCSTHTSYGDGSQNFLHHQVRSEFFFHGGRSIFATPTPDTPTLKAIRRSPFHSSSPADPTT